LACRRRGAHQRAGRMTGRKQLKINFPAPRLRRGAGASINPVPTPVIRSGHPPAGGGPNPGARAPEKIVKFLPAA